MKYCEISNGNIINTQKIVNIYTNEFGTICVNFDNKTNLFLTSEEYDSLKEFLEKENENVSTSYVI